MKNIIIILYTLHLIFLAYLNNFYLAGLPFRSLLILLCGGLAILNDPEILAKFRKVNIIYAILAITGLVVSIANQVTLGNIVNGELKLLQSYLMVLSSYYIIDKFGFKVLGIIFLGVTGFSAIFGILQWIDLQLAWHVHDLLGELQNKEQSDEIQSQIEEVLDRSPGLSLYAIPQTYMLIAAIIINSYFVLKYRDEPLLQALLLMKGTLMLMGIFVTETRSALGAALVIMGLIYLKGFPTKTIILMWPVIIVGVIGYLVSSGGSDSDSRMMSLDDASAAGRMTLYKYGAELFIRQPFGYGFNFDTVEYATEYFVNQYNLFDYGADEKAQYIVPVHNSILNIVHTYGFIGLLVLFYYVLMLIDGLWYRIVFLLGAFLNSIFHNSGILMNDLFIDIVIAVFLYESYLKQQLNAKYGDYI
jgi:hypothetical protein